AHWRPRLWSALIGRAETRADDSPGRTQFVLPQVALCGYKLADTGVRAGRTRIALQKSSTLMALRTNHPLAVWLIGLTGLALAAASARPYAGAWNDGSRLAAVESLADRHTLVIDNSIFCRPSLNDDTRTVSPYDPQNENLLAYGTRDKLWIDSHFYS